MKVTKVILIAMSWAACQFGALAADDGASDSKGKASSIKTDDSTKPTVTTPTPPAKPDNSAISTDIKTIVQNFEQAREVLLADQKTLQDSLKNASQDQRDKIREQLAATKDALAAQREQFRDQLKEARAKLLDQAKKLKDDASDAAKKTGKPRGN